MPRSPFAWQLPGVRVEQARAPDCTGSAVRQIARLDCVHLSRLVKTRCVLGTAGTPRPIHSARLIQGRIGQTGVSSSPTTQRYNAYAEDRKAQIGY